MSKLKGKNKLRQRKAEAPMRERRAQQVRIMENVIRRVVNEAIIERKALGTEITQEMMNERIRKALGKMVA